MRTNEKRLSAALDSVLDNAVARTRDGDTIKITAFGQVGEVVIEVSHLGIGIAPDHLRHIFDPSWKHHNRIGVMIARNAVGALGGSVTVTSEPNVGTIVRITLPRVA